MLIRFDFMDIAPDSALISEDSFPRDTFSFMASAFTLMLPCSVSSAALALVTSAAMLPDVTCS